MSLSRRILFSFAIVVLLACAATALILVGGQHLLDGGRDVSFGPIAAIASGLVALTASAALVLSLYRSISRPLNRLAVAAEAFGGGDLHRRVPVISADELGRLAHAFNDMAAKLSQTTVSREHLNDALDSTAGALILIGPEQTIDRLNSGAQQLLGYTEHEISGRRFEALLAEGDREAEGDDPTIMRLAVEGHLRNEERVFIRKDGSEVPVSLSGSTLRNDDGDVVGFVCVAHDLTRQKQVEERIRASLRRKELLLREVHHRVKNNLQVVSSLLDLQSGAVSDPEIRAMFQESQNRIRSMALIHEQLYSDPEGPGMEIRDFVEKLTGRLLESYGLASDQVTLRLRLEQHPLDVDQAIAFGLILNELVANSLKHAFTDGDNGEVVVRFHSTDNGRLSMAVSDTGKGLSADFDLNGGDSLGLNLVASLAEQLGGTLQLQSDGGTEFRIDFPASVDNLTSSAPNAE